MIGRKSIVGMALFSALLFSAFAVQSASAATFEATTNTTAVTCAPEAEGEFEDAHCDHFVGKPNGSFSHKEIAPGTATAIAITNANTANNTTESTKAILHGTVAGVAVEITATTVSGTGTIKNNNTTHNVEGEVEVEYTGLSIDGALSGCHVEPIKFNTTFQGARDATSGTMGLKFSPKTGNVFVEFRITECIFANTYKFEGNMTATGNGSNGDGGHGSGATWVFKPEDEELTFFGNAMSLEQTVTARMSGTGGNPIALTTTP